MSGYKTHVSVYLIMAAVTALFLADKGIYPFDGYMLLAINIGIIYAILPDLDISSSKISEIASKVGLGFVILSIVYLLATNDKTPMIISLAVVLVLFGARFLHHRGSLHTITAGVLLSAPLVYFNPIYALYAFMGFMCHLLLDGIT